jgi:dephospho-CoA kinase
VECFGRNILNADGTLDRKNLGSIAFNDLDKLKLLNHITHPEIRRVIEEKIDMIMKNAAGCVIVVDAAVLLEAGIEELVDEIWLVYVNVDTQMERLMYRDHLTFNEAEARVNSQMPVEEKIKYSDIIIDNNGHLEYTKKQVEKLWQHIMNTGGKPVASKG